MAGERTLVVNIIGDSASVERAFAKTGAAADAASAQMGKAAKSVETTGTKIEATGKKIEKVGTGLSKYVSLPLLGVGAAAVHMGLDFDKTMLLVETHTESSKKQVDEYKKAILEMSASGKYTQGPTELGEAMYHIASDGYHGQKALEALRESADLAMLGQSDLAETTYAVVSAMKTGIKGTEDLHDTIGVLNGTMGAGDTKMGELTAAMSTGVVPAAKAMGLELTDVGAALAFLTARGVPAQKAAYGLAMNFQQLIPYTEKASKAFERLGLGQDELAEKAEDGPDGWLKALRDLQQHLDGLNKYQRTSTLEEIFGGGRTSRGVLAQLQNLNDLEATYERLDVIAGKTDKNLHTARESEANQWSEEWAQIQADLVELGDEITPVLIPLLQDVSHDVEDVVHAFDQLPTGTKEWMVKLGLAAVALGPVVKGVGTIVTLVGKATKAFEGMTEAEAAANLGGGVGVPLPARSTATAAATAAATGTAAAETEAAVVPRWLGTESTNPVFGSFLWAGPTGGRALIKAGQETVKDGALPALSESDAVRDALGIGAGGAVSSTLKGLASKAFITLGGLAGGYFAAEFGAHAIEGITGADLLENQSLKTSLTHGFNTSGVAADEHRGLTEAGHRERGINPGFAAGTHAELLNYEHSFHDTLTTIEGEAAGGLKQIDASLAQGLQTADDIWIHGTAPWRDHTAKAMEASVAAINEGMADGTIKAKAGQQQINQLLREIHLVRGDDPFGLAKATASSFEKAHGLTEKGVKQWESSLGMMPKAARTSSIDSTNQMLQAWAEGHPKLEHEIESLTRFEISHFGATNKQLREGVKKGATGPVADAFQEAAEGVGGALTNIGTNTNAMLKALGIHDMVEFQAIVFGPSRMGSTQLNSEGGGARAAGESKHHNYAGGGFTRVPGAGLDDTVGLRVNGVMSAMVAPGEDLMVVNRHQRGPLDYAVANTFGVRGMDGFFGAFDRPHYAAKGSVNVRGPRAIGAVGHGALTQAAAGVNKYFEAHQPKVTAGASSAPYTGKTPAGVGTFQGFPVDKWIIPELEYAVAHGWTGHITSGYRTPAHSAELGFPGDEHTKKGPYPYGAVDFGGIHEAAALANRAAFIRATRGYRGPELQLPIGFVDDGHMSGTGHARGGIAMAARGLPPGLKLHGPPMFKREGPAQYQRAFDLFGSWSHGAPYQTKLASRQEHEFKSFVEQHPRIAGRYHPYTDKTDYDLRGWWLNERGNVAHDHGQTYLTDTYKTPYSVGFSKWSEYANRGTPYDWVDENVGEGVLVNLKTGQIILDHRFAPNAAGEYTKARGGPVPQGFASGGVVQTAGSILMSNGLTPVAAAAIIGNAYQESSWDPASVGDEGGGLWGFTSGSESLAALQAYAASQHKPWTDVATQTQFLLHNLPGSTKALLNRQTSAGTGAAIFMENWEHPAEETENQSRREEGAVMALHMLGFSSGSDASTELGGAPSGSGGKQFKAKYEKGRYGKGRTVAGGTSAGFAPKKEIQAALKAGAAHAANPTVSHDIPTSKLPSWGVGLPLYQREELEGRGTTLPERETILGNAEANATFESGVAGRALQRAKAAYAKNPTTANWEAVAKGSSREQVERKAQAAATSARKAFEKGYIKHLTAAIKKVNAELASAAGKLSVKQVAALRAKRAELVSLRASARGESQGAVEKLSEIEEAGEMEAAETESESPLGMAAASISESFGEGYMSEMAQKGVEAAEAAARIPGQEKQARLALAELTEGTSDDLAVLDEMRTETQQKLAVAQQQNNWEAITEAAQTLKGIEESIKSLEGGGEAQAQVAEEMKSLREAIEAQTALASSAIGTNSAVAWQALAEIMSGTLGAKTNHQSLTSGDGSLGTV